MRVSVDVAVLAAMCVVGMWSVGRTQQMIDCQKLTSCSCAAPTGIIDLSPLDSHDPNKPTFTNIADGISSQTFYSFNPCTAFSDSSGCTNVAVCQQTSDGVTYNCGIQENVQFIKDQTKGLTLQTNAEDEFGTTRTSNIQLICDKSTEKQLTSSGENPTGTYNFVLTSKYACPSSGSGKAGLSAGSILCIVLVVVVVVYLVGGILYNKFLLGARGVEMVPNHEFWSDFPSLVKDGAMFTFRGCKSKITSNYESI